MSAFPLAIHVLGDLTVVADGRPVTVPGSRKTRALLVYLLLQPRPVTREHLCELLWPHPDDPRAALRWSLTKLRPILNAGTPHLVTDRASVVIEGLDDHVDLRRIERLLARPPGEIPTADLEAAADLFHGELFEGTEIPDCHRFNHWLSARSEAARRSRRVILETLTARLADEPERALVHARARITLDPLDEGANVDVVRLLGTLGRKDEALEQAARCREILDVELGVPPGPGLAAALRDMKRMVGTTPAAAAPRRRMAPLTATGTGLFGRAAECVHLESFLAANDRHSILLFTGEPGIGKSRLLEELCRRAEARGDLVLKGRSWEIEMVRPFGVWIELLADLPHDLVPADLRAELAPVMPSLEEPLPERGDMEGIMRAMEGLLAHIDGAGRNAVLMFDDIHWIDRASAQLLGFVSSSRGGLRFGIAGAARPGEFADNEAARSLVRSWNRAGRLQQVPVAPLPKRDAAALARSLSDTVDVDQVVASCGGNPLYLVASVRESPGNVAGSVASLVSDRLAALDEPTCEIVRWAAVMGRSFPATTMADLVSQPLPDLLTRTDALEQHGILRSAGDQWSFAHDLLRRGALAGLSGPRRALMHRHVAHTLARKPDPHGILAGEVAFHAGRGGESQLAAESAVSAGDRALRLAAFDDAWRIADRGLEETAGLPDDSTIELRVELLRVQVLATMGRRQGESITAQLAHLARRARAADLPSAERTAHWLLSVVAEEAGDLDAARRHSLGARAAGQRAEPLTRLRALANTARCLVQLEREPERAEVLLNEARSLSESLQTNVLDIPWGFGLLHAMHGRAEEARAGLAQGAAMAHDEGNHWARFECLSWLSILDLFEGHLAGVEERNGVLQEVAGQLGEGSEQALATTLLALARRQAGLGVKELDAALVELQAADSKGRLAFALNEAGRLDLAAGDLQSAARRAEEAIEASTEVGRLHQRDRAMSLRIRIALLEGDEATIDRCSRWLAQRIETLNPDLPVHGDLRRLQDDIANHRERKR